jgi:hypothetical protein
MRGRAVGRGLTRRIVQFDGDDEVIGIRPHLVRVLPRCQWRYWPYDEQDGRAVLWLLDFESRSWAKLIHTTPDASEGAFPVCRYGPRRLWDEVDAAHQWRVDHGKPAADRWRFIVTADNQRIELISD